MANRKLTLAGLTTGDFVEYIIRFAAVLTMTILAFTVPAFKDVADTYFALGIFALLTSTITVIGKLTIPGFHKFLPFDYNFAETKWFGFRIPTWVTIFLATIAGLSTLLALSQTQYLINAPTFQVILPNALNSSILAGVAGIVENILFFSAVWEFLHLVFAFIFFKTVKNPLPMVSMILSGAILPWLFLLYHNTVYGIDQKVTSQAVVGFGYEIVIMTMIFRNYAWAHMRHFFNNFAVVLYAQTTLLTVLIQIANSLVTLFIGMVITAMTSVILLRSKSALLRAFGVIASIITVILLIAFIGGIGIFS